MIIIFSRLLVDKFMVRKTKTLINFICNFNAGMVFDKNHLKK